MEITGKIKMVGDTETFGSNGFRKRELVITTEEQYPQHILIEFVQDKVDLLNSYNIGQEVKVGLNLRGREWLNPQGESKYFNSIQGWRIDKAQPDATAINNATAMVDNKFEPASNMGSPEQDNLPF
jgi:hypothetical protein